MTTMNQRKYSEGGVDFLENQQVSTQPTGDESLWISPREAFRLFDISVPWLHKLAAKTPSPLITKVVQKGRIRNELRIWRPSLEAYLGLEITAGKDEVWGRQTVLVPA